MQVIFNDSERTVTISLDDFYKHFTSGQKEQIIPVTASLQQTVDLETQVTNLLGQIGMPRNIKGFSYIRKAILIAIQNPGILEYFTKDLYPSIARSYDTTSSRAERAIRHAIEVAWDRGNVAALDSLFGYPVSSRKSKPTNSEFISLLVDHMRLQLKEGGGFGENA